MLGIGLLAAVTILYAGYNVLIKVSGGYVPAGVTSTILATICLQIAALLTSVIFISILALRGGQSFSLSSSRHMSGRRPGFLTPPWLACHTREAASGRFL